MDIQIKKHCESSHPQEALSIFRERRLKKENFPKMNTAQ